MQQGHNMVALTTMEPAEYPRPVLASKAGCGPDSRIVIVGPQRMLNGLMALHIEQAIGIACHCCEPTELRHAAAGGAALRGTLLLLDCRQGEPAGVREEYGLAQNGPAMDSRLCCFNVIRGSGHAAEIEALRQGIHGVFYDSDPVEMLTKGVLAVLNGEFWYSREVLGRFVMGGPPQQSRPARSPLLSGMTLREAQILELIAAGLRNDEIAERLHISHHTVKTHAFNIYRKINVLNRIQASLWVASQRG